MRGPRFLLIAALLFIAPGSAFAIEGPTSAGPIGGTDIRSGLLPPPGLYGGTIQLGAGSIDFVDGSGRTIPALQDAHLSVAVGGPFIYYIPSVKVLGGSIAFAGIVPGGNFCGRHFSGTSTECSAGVGDPYIEIDWARFFGKFHPSKFTGAYPIPEGLSILVGFGVVLPTGKYDPSTQLTQATSPGTNIWDFAPSLALTYTTAPILVDGTEISAKFFWNNYLENPQTHYLTGDLLDLDFAVTEHIGRFQVGATGFYAFQVEDDTVFGVRVPPDGRQADILQLGGLVAYDMPECDSSVKIKALSSVFADNRPSLWEVALGWIKKF
jgi:hypothetical protein